MRYALLHDVPLLCTGRNNKFVLRCHAFFPRGKGRDEIRFVFVFVLR